MGLLSIFLTLKAVGQVTVNVSDNLNDWISVMNEQSQVKTPIIEALAKRGVVFTNARSTDAGHPREAYEGSGINVYVYKKVH